MIVYADREETVDPRAFLERIRKARDPQERLILEGQFESALCDSLCPEFDEEVDLCRATLPPRITVRQPEGYAFYSVYPEMYADAAMRFLADHRPDGCVVIGIRSIGASLSRVVAETVHSSFRTTVRPRGHPFHRELRLSPALEERLQSFAARAWFLIVDEGPGLSGSSFMSVAAKLEQLGVSSGRIVLFPAHDPNPDNFVSEHARQNWRRYPQYVEPFRADRFVPSGARDISGGNWRALLYADESEYPAAHPHHERRKYLHENVLWKFSGLGHLGRSKYERAQRLHEFCPPVLGFEKGFVLSRWVEARPARLSESFLETMARYLTFLRAEFVTEQPVPATELEAMIERNTGQRVEAPQEGVVVAVDGRMLPQEWLESPTGYTKTDALDHHDDHFFPGCQDIAWDIAGASVEWSLPSDALTDRYLRRTQDRTLRARLPFYVTAYKAYRYGYCHMAAETLGDSPDGRRFRKLMSFYKQ